MNVSGIVAKDTKHNATMCKPLALNTKPICNPYAKKHMTSNDNNCNDFFNLPQINNLKPLITSSSLCQVTRNNQKIVLNFNSVTPKCLVMINIYLSNTKTS